MTDNKNQDSSQTEGQTGIDRETELRNRENEAGQAKEQQFGQDKGQAPTDKEKESFVGSGKDSSSDYLTKGEANPELAAKGQGAQDSDAGRSDIETGQPTDRDAKIDDGSDSNR